MGVFAVLQKTRVFRRRNLAFIERSEDADLILEIGFHQEQGKPLTMKALQLSGLVSVPTLQRRLRHLRQAGVVQTRKSARDGRAVELVLSPKVVKAYARYGELIRELQFADPAGQTFRPE